VVVAAERPVKTTGPPFARWARQGWLRRPADQRNERLLPMRVDVEWTRALLGPEKGMARISLPKGTGRA